ncbi:MAG TPA: tetratricopeptide repeat protein, partial [Planctomycetota bacterium]|nr:tetratricopeptide repeat protein [Planctomycetota bacterium]
MPAAERDALLQRECAGNVELERRLRAMLAAAEDRRFLASPAETEPATKGAVREGPGSVIGPYKLVKLLGEGGFGAVFLAEQEKPVARQVALKIIKLGMDTRQVVARFEQERQALALMDHPNIARVIDAGATETGRPYFVMDLVDGVPISEYCDKHNLPIDERLALFAQVCHAVQHAHSKGIIHRDLKPSNILVAAQDGRPQVKIIDFGIAKATNTRLTDKTVFTEHLQVIGTLQYMSPEQAEGSLDIDTRTDVYALGVVLYELLTGSTPFDEKTLRSAFYDEVQRMIREVEPPKPSTRLSNSLDTIASIAARRRVEPRRLGTLVRGELDWIVMKALEKDRTRRYETAKSFAEDVLRFLAGEPIVAAPPSATYRVVKFVRRHRVGVGAAGVLAGTLVAGLGGTWWGMLEAERGRTEAQAQRTEAQAQRNEAQAQRTEAERQRNEAEHARAQLEKIADFQARMLRRVPAFEMGRDLAADLSARVRDAQGELEISDEQRARALATFNALLGGISMTDAARRILDVNVLTPSSGAVAAELGDEPLTQAALHHTLARTYGELGIFDKAKEQAQLELELREKHQGAEHRDTLLALTTVGQVSWRLGEVDEAERILEGTTPRLVSALGAEDPVTLDARESLGVLMIARGRNEEALACFQELLAIRERTVGPDAESVALTLTNLGAVLLNLRRVEQAAPLLERSLSIRQRRFGAEDAETLKAQQNLADAYEDQRRFHDANRLRSEAIQTLARIRGANHPDTISAIAKLAGLYQRQNRFDEAEVQARRALELRRVVLGDAHPLTIDSMSSVAILCSTLGKHAAAELLFAEAVQRSTETFGAEASKTMDRVNNLAVCYWFQGKFAQVEPLFTKSLEFARKNYGEQSAETAFAMNNLAILLHRMGRLEEERPMLEQALAISVAKLGEDDPKTLHAKAGLAVLLLDTGELDRAEELLRALIEAQDRVLGENNPSTLESKSNLAALLDRKQLYDEEGV